ncbi:MAG: hypothetical protein AVDCRST_MAG16-3021, partial [uncultured Frankineae bacterium]
CSTPTGWSRSAMRPSPTAWTASCRPWPSRCTRRTRPARRCCGRSAATTAR